MTMKTKVCTTCNEPKPDTLEFFSRMSKDSKEFRGSCKGCQNKNLRRWQKANPENIKISRTKTNVAIKALSDRLKSAPCTDCGKTYPPCVMDWDHVRGEKLYNPGNMLHKCMTAKYLIEIEKCELVCSNCHRIRTFITRTNNKKKTE